MIKNVGVNQSRSRKAFYNTLSSFGYEFVVLICGLILPRLVLSVFGSAYNGITTSITQFISVISLMKAGIGGVTRAALYDPLANNDCRRISEIVYETQQFMHKVAFIFILGVAVFSFVYPTYIVKDFSFPFTASLIIIISISSFSQYYFGFAYQMLLAADQKQTIIYGIQILTTILNTFVVAILIKLGFGIHVVKLASSIAYAINPIVFNLYCRKHYHLEQKKGKKTHILEQRWDALGHEVANFINTNTDIIVLTVFTNIKEVSVYTVYYYVTSSVHKLVSNFVISFGSAFGDMYAKKEIKLMYSNLEIFELIIFSVSSIVYSVTASLITPFALLYTKGVNDISYNRPLFGLLLSIAGVFACFRIPYYSITTALGHYKQTRNGAFIEALINICVSLVLVVFFHLGLIGVAIGTLLAAIYRSIQYAYYLSNHILKRSIMKFFLHVIVAIFIMAVTVLFSLRVYYIVEYTVFTWILKGIIDILFSTTLTIIINLIFWKYPTQQCYKKLSVALLRQNT